jgi:N-acetylmuramoyl-L-alanine amidase
MYQVKRLVVIIDAGHGVGTPGKRSPDGSLREYNFNKPTAIYLENMLREYENVVVYTVYDKNGPDVPLKERTDKANAIYNKYAAEVKAGTTKVIYISIHANAEGSTWSDASGIETFVYVTKPKEALELASNVQNHLIRETSRKNRGVKTADFHVLRETHMTAILVECGFMTNKEECALLKTPAYQQRVATGILKGIEATYTIKKKAASKTPPVTAAKPKPPSVPQQENVTYRVVVGSFKDRPNAEEQIKKLEKAGFKAFIDIVKG